MSRSKFIQKRSLKSWLPLAFIVVFGALGAYFLLETHAQTTEQASVNWTTITSNELKNINSGLCLGTPGTTEAATYTKLSLQPCKATKGQEWTVAWGVGTVKSATAVNGYGQCLDDTAESTKAGTQIEVYPCDKDPLAQTWTTGYGDGTIRIHNLCLGVSGNAKTSGAAVVIMVCNATTPPPPPPPTSGGGTGSGSGGGTTQTGGGASSGGGGGSPAPTPQPTGGSSQSNDNSDNTVADNSVSNDGVDTVDGTDTLDTTDTGITPDTSPDTNGTLSTDGSGDTSGGTSTYNSGVNGAQSKNQSSKSKSSTQNVNAGKGTSSAAVGATFVMFGILIPVCVLAIFFIKKRQAAPVAVSTAADSDAFLKSISSSMAPPTQTAEFGPSEPVLTTPVTVVNPSEPYISVATATPPVHHAQAGENEAAAKARLEWWAPNGGSQQQPKQPLGEVDNPPDMFEEGEKRLAAEENIRNNYRH